MFVHGRECYRRNSFMVIYFFYKNIIFVLPIFWYGIFSAFSGTMIYNLWLYQSYNFAYTGMPIVWYCTYDWEHSKSRLMNEPSLYEIGLQNKCFNRYKFWSSYINAIWQSFVLTLITYLTLNHSCGVGLVASSDSIILEESAFSGSLLLNGAFIFQAVVWAVNVKILILTNTHSCISLFW